MPMKADVIQHHSEYQARYAMLALWLVNHGEHFVHIGFRFYAWTAFNIVHRPDGVKRHG